MKAISVSRYPLSTHHPIRTISSRQFVKSSRFLIGFAALLLLVPTCSFGQTTITLDELAGVMESAWQTWQGVKDYTCLFYRQEWVDGHLREKETILVKFRKTPHSLYMKWIADPHRGRETLFVSGRNNNKIKVHQGGLMGSININLNPLGYMAKKSCRHTVFEAGIGHTIGLLRDGLQLAKVRKNGIFTHLGRKNYEGLNVRCYRAVFPKSEAKPDNTYCAVQGKYHAADTTVCIDDRNHLPVVVENRNASGELIEYYGNENLRMNTGLADLDFGPGNREYRF